MARRIAYRPLHLPTSQSAPIPQAANESFSSADLSNGTHGNRFFFHPAQVNYVSSNLLVLRFGSWPAAPWRALARSMRPLNTEIHGFNRGAPHGTSPLPSYRSLRDKSGRRPSWTAARRGFIAHAGHEEAERLHRM